ncbi:LPS export ABC transporter periplasmic protein LptC [Sphingomonas sp. CJ99]
MSDAIVPAAAARQAGARWALPGGRHDRIVGLLQTVLPIGIGVLAAFLVMAPLTMGGDVSFILDKNKVEVAPERLRIERAQYRGADSGGRGFQINAGSAVQKSAAEPIVQLNDLAARINLDDGPAALTAERGRYDIDRQQVAIDGPIRFRAANGYALDTRDALVDLRTKRLRSGSAVTGTTNMGNFSADRLDADLEARTVSLRGNARLRIYPGRTK